jgi:hypothetical protein
MVAYSSYKIVKELYVWKEGFHFVIEDIKYGTYKTERMDFGLYGAVGINFKIGQDSFIFLSAGCVYNARPYFEDLKLLLRPTLGYTF